MSSHRRDFLHSLLSSGALAGILAPAMFGDERTPKAHLPDALEEAPHDSLAFWSGFFDSVNPDVRGGMERGPQDMPDPKRIVQYMHFNEERGLRFVQDIESKELLDYDGDVLVSVSLGQYRPANADSMPSQFRLDCVQTKPIINVLTPLAWSAIVALQPDKAGKMPSLDQLGFKSDAAVSGTKKVIFTKGIGKMAVNISRSSNRMQSFLGAILKYTKMASPVLSLPAISIPAIQTFSEVYSYWEERTRFIMNSPLTLSVASQQAAQDPEGGIAPLRLVSGYYVMLPEEHVDPLANEIKNLKIQDGYLVSKNASTDQSPQQRQMAVANGVTYATMRVTVQQLDTSALISPASDSGCSDSGEEQSRGGTSPKNKTTATTGNRSRSKDERRNREAIGVIWKSWQPDLLHRLRRPDVARANRNGGAGK